MFQRKPRRFGRNSNGRSHRPHGGTGMQTRPRTNSFSNAQPRSSFRPSMSAEKLFEKYTSLAKEAMSSGDKTLSENYLQHADHFMRIIDERNKNRALNENKTEISQETQTNQNNNSENKD